MDRPLSAKGAYSWDEADAYPPGQGPPPEDDLPQEAIQPVADKENTAPAQKKKPAKKALKKSPTANSKRSSAEGPASPPPAPAEEEDITATIPPAVYNETEGQESVRSAPQTPPLSAKSRIPRNTILCSGKDAYTWDEADAYPAGEAPPPAAAADDDNVEVPSPAAVEETAEEKAPAVAAKKTQKSKVTTPEKTAPATAAAVNVEDQVVPGAAAAAAEEGGDGPGSGTLFNQMLEKQLAAEGGGLPPGSAAGGSPGAKKEGDGEDGEEDASLEELIKSNKWESRVKGFGKLKSLFEEIPMDEVVAKSDQWIELDGFASQFAVLIADKNVNAQKAALEAVCAFFRKCESKARAEEVFKPLTKLLFENVLSTPKSAAVGQQLILDCIEVAEATCFIKSMTEFMDSLLDKNGNPNVRGPAAKHTLGVLTALREVFKAFGSSAVKPEDFLGRVQKYAGVTDKNVKEMAFHILCDVFLLSKSVDHVKGNLPSNKASELEKRCKELEEAEAPVPTRMYRSLKRKLEEKGEVAVPQANKAITGDILKMLNAEKWEKAVNEAAKWNHKKALLDELLALVQKTKNPKTSSDFSSIVSVLSRTVNLESNIAVVTSAIKCAGALCICLGKHFDKHARILVPVVLPRLKDKSKPLQAACEQFLADTLECTSFDTLVDDAGRLAVNDKNPSAKLNGLNWCCTACKHPAQADAIVKCGKTLLINALNNMDDPTPDVRSAASDLFREVASRVPHKVVHSSMDDASERARSAAESIIANLDANPSDHQPPSSHQPSGGGGEAKSKPPSKKSNEEPKPSPRKPQGKSSIPPASPTRNQQMRKKTVPGSRVKKPVGAGGTKRADGVVNEDDTPQCTLDDTMATDGLASLLAEDAQLILDWSVKAGWKEKADSFEGLRLWLTENKAVGTHYTEHVTVFCRSRTKDWKESNVTTMRAVLDLLMVLPDIGGKNFTRSAANVVLQGWIEKIGDARLGAGVADLLSKYSSHFSPRFVVACIMPYCKPSSSAKVHIALCPLLELLIQDFGLDNFNVPLLAEYAKTVVESRTTTIRASGQNLAVIMYQYVGDSLFKMFGSGDLKAPSLDKLRAACQKGKEVPPVPKRIARKGKIEDDDGETDEPPDDEDGGGDVLPPQFVSGLVKDLLDSRYKVRQEALSKIPDMINKLGGVIRPKGLATMALVYRRALQDSNKGVMLDAHVVLAALADGLGSGARAYVAGLLPPVFNNFSEKTPEAREAVEAASSAWLAACGPGPWVTALIASGALVDTSEHQKETLLQQIASDDLPFDKVLDTDLHTLLPVAVEFLGEEEQLATALIDKIVPRVGVHRLKRLYADQKRSVQQILEKIIAKHGREEAETRRRETEPAAAGGEVTGRRGTLNGGPQGGVGLGASTGGADKGGSGVDGFIVRWTPAYGKGDKEELKRGGGKWALNLSQEDLDWLQAAWKPHVNDALLFAMFEKSQFIRVVKALDFWREYVTVEENYERVYESEKAVCELLLKWASSKLSGTNPSLITAACDFLLELFRSLEERKSQLSPDELQVIGTHLADKVGHPTQDVRAKLCEVLHALSFVSNIHELFIILMRGLASSNKRSVVKCIQAIARLIARAGRDVCNNEQRDALKLATLTEPTSGDPLIQDAALKALVCLHAYVGDALFDMTAQVSDLRPRLEACAARNPNLRAEYIGDFPEPGSPGREPRLEDGGEGESGGGGGGQQAEGGTTQPAAPKKSAPVEEKQPPKDYTELFLRAVGDYDVVPLLEKVNALTLTLEQAVIKQQNSIRIYQKEEECRRNLEGVSEPVEYDVAQKNGQSRMEAARRHGSRDLVVSLAIEKLCEEDEESAMSALETLAAHTPRNSYPQWAVLLAPQLGAAFCSALSFCFDPRRLKQATDWRLTSLCEALLRRVAPFTRSQHSLFQLAVTPNHKLFRQAFQGLAVHADRENSPHKESINKLLEQIVGKDMVQFATPTQCFRHQCVEMFCSYLINKVDITPSEAAILFKVVKRASRRLNMRKEPPQEKEKSYYLRIFHGTTMCLKWIDTRKGVTLSERNQKIFEEYLRQILYIVTTVCPNIVGIYLRDKNFLSARNASFTNRVIELMNRERVHLQEDAKEFESHEFRAPTGLTYPELHQWYAENKPVFMLQLPVLHYPYFNVEQLVEQAAPEQLRVYDPTLYEGFDKQRDAFHPDMPEGPYVEKFQKAIDDISASTGIRSSPEAAANIRQFLREGYSRSEIISSQIKRVVELRLEFCGTELAGESVHPAAYLAHLEFQN